jgi:4-aminobutyrate aminotransferase-like enzyme/Ser/Thr protein kinase RdoA (MazF antagonist)
MSELPVVVRHAPRFTAEEAERLAADRFGVAGRASPLPSERDQNFRIRAADGTSFILKVANERERPEILDFQERALAHLAERSPTLVLPRVVPDVEGRCVGRVPHGGAEHLVRLLTWVPGRVLAETRPHTRTLLASLGRALGRMDRAFEGFAHPSMNRPLQWDLGRLPWIAAEAGRFEPPRRALVERVVGRFADRATPILGQLRRQVIHNDWNDHNVIVGVAEGSDERRPDEPLVLGAVDFGDMLESWTVADLAVACAYAMLGKLDPVGAAAAIVEGYHSALPLEEAELDVLLDLVRARLAISVTMAACQSAQAPDNEYLRVSERVAWDLLSDLDAVEPAWAIACFRKACGRPASRTCLAVRDWLAARTASFAQVVNADLRGGPIGVLDLGVGSLDVPSLAEVGDLERFCRLVERQVAGSAAGIGRYDEARLVYATDLFRHANNWEVENRTVHIGIDVFLPAGAQVRTPLAGRVHSCRNNAGAGDYGPTIVLEHAPEPGIRFFTLYGHLSEDSLDGLAPGRAFAAGDAIARLGDAGVNGGWPPHLHFQVITDLLGASGDFPGVAAPSERAVYLELCPDPNLILGIPAARFPAPAPSSAEILAARRRHLGRNLSVSYRRPLAIVRGDMQFLFDADGRRFLDAVNNVPHVGHGHPRVVAAAARQLAVLNTNTRYVHPLLASYAERLAASMPPPLSVCYIVCSGSEANELALRLARAHASRGRGRAAGRAHEGGWSAPGIVVVDGAYHGNTTSLVDISPYKFDGPGGRGRPAHTRKVPMPDVFRGPYRADRPDAGALYARHVADAVAEFEAEGRGVAAFFCESLLSCGGQIVLPEGYLRAAYAAVRRAGGVCVADEVQVGFGRVGTHLWGFETQGVVPDIVTLGKPIGNGFPLAAVVTTPEVADAFDDGMEYFNTFGGSQAACAAGHAVLDVMRDEGLQARAVAVGGRLRSGLASLGARFPVVGDVRGLGLFLGVELVLDRETLEPAARQADYVVNRLRDRGILVSTDGPFHNVLKIKPPLQFADGDADRLVEELAAILEEDGARTGRGSPPPTRG